MIDAIGSRLMNVTHDRRLVEGRVAKHSDFDLTSRKVAGRSVGRWRRWRRGVVATPVASVLLRCRGVAQRLDSSVSSVAS